LPLRTTKHLFVPLLLFMVLLGSIPSSAAAAYPLRATAAGAPNREVFGFALAASLSDPTVG